METSHFQWTSFWGAGQYDGAAELPFPLETEIPPAWKMPSEMTGWPLCAIFKRDPATECSFRFEDSKVIEKCKALGYSPERGDGDDPQHFDGFALREARQDLAATRLQEALWKDNLFDLPPKKGLEAFQEIHRLFPWNVPVHRELGIRNDQAGNIEKAFAEMRAAILLDPADAPSWQSLSVVLRRMNCPKDSAVALGISKAFEAMQP